MAELMLILHRSSGYYAGDIFAAFTRRRIQCVHAEHLCNPKLLARNGDGLFDPETMCCDFLRITHQYEFRRVALTRVEREELAGGKTEEFAIDPQAVALWKKEGKLPLFGRAGREVWYRGLIDVSPPKVAAVWDAIESRTAHRRSDSQYARFPAGRVERKTKLLLETDDFDDATAEELVKPLTAIDEKTGETIEVAKRAHSVDLATLGLSAKELEDARDVTKDFDLRGVKQAYSRAAIARAKPIPDRIPDDKGAEREAQDQARH